MATDLLIIELVAVIQVIVLTFAMLTKIGTITLAAGVIGIFNLGQTFNTHSITYMSNGTLVTLSQTDLNTVVASLAILTITTFMCLLWQLGVLENKNPE